MTQLRPIFVVAMEYLGADVEPRRGTPRHLVREHAFDVRAGELAAHDAHPPRVGFPDSQRGWASVPCAPRCAECTTEVDIVVAAAIAEQLRSFLAH